MSAEHECNWCRADDGEVVHLVPLADFAALQTAIERVEAVCQDPTVTYAVINRDDPTTTSPLMVEREAIFAALKGTRTAPADRIARLADQWDGGADAGREHIAECVEHPCPRCVLAEAAIDLRAAAAVGAVPETRDETEKQR